MSRLERSSYERYMFGWRRGFKEQFLEKDQLFWKIAAFVGESLVRTPGAMFDVDVRYLTVKDVREPYQVELHCIKDGKTLARLDVLPSTLGCTTPEECREKLAGRIPEIQEFVRDHATKIRTGNS